ncbi:hypothetical protein [Faecalibacillus intestinalis]|jgi:vacuolar-type H+-ATPase subunit I/STV1|uniref:hypothetical protein n=1 Tax=Faecalibacillus intestinalis TaxID=1982626 RepID=UPI002059ACE7|nr:hypothetical protein [Faecalibacillus intestinalis]DAK81670.1 MAG TPA: hypothetical protein [Caudoviricetes sp.]DAV54906.1 MAG TPA: hypothetical protein [Caudoviricetes sp.]
MGLFDLVREEQEAKKKAEESAKEDVKDTVVKEVKKVEEAPKEADQQPAPVAKAEKQATEIAEESKKEEKPAGKKVPKKKASTEKTYKYPFGVYSEGRLIDISSYGFVPGKTYKEDEITKIMLQHQHYEFAGKMEYSFIKEDNVLVVSIAQHRKG